MLRLAVQRMHARKMTSFEKRNARIEAEIRKSVISTYSEHLAMGFNTILPFDMLEQFQTASLSHFSRIADYIELGEGVWYTIQGSNVVFKDGKMDEEAQEPGPYMTSFR